MEYTRISWLFKQLKTTFSKENPIKFFLACMINNCMGFMLGYYKEKDKVNLDHMMW